MSDTATDPSMQAAASKLEGLLFPEDAPESEELEDIQDDEVLEDGESLPLENDSESEDDGSEEDDLGEIAEGDELSLADYLGIDEDRIVVGEDGQPLFNAIIDGETQQVPLKDLAKNFQLQSYTNNKSIALETERKEFEEVRERAASELSQRLTGVEKLTELAEGELVNEYNSIDWDTLRQTDPANWTAYRQEYAERARKIQEVKSLAQQEQQRLADENQAKFKESANEYYQGELRSMIADNPEWADESKRNADMSEMKSFITRYGFTESDANGVNDHRLIRLIKDAKAYQEGKAKGEKKRLVKELPKFQKPGSKTNAANLAKARKAKALKAKVKKSGSVRDIAASIVDRM